MRDGTDFSPRRVKTPSALGGHSRRERCDRRRGSRQAVRPGGGGRGDLVLRSARNRVRAARPQRRRQNDDAGVLHRSRQTDLGTGARPRSGSDPAARARSASAADRRAAPGDLAPREGERRRSPRALCRVLRDRAARGARWRRESASTASSSAKSRRCRAANNNVWLSRSRSSTIPRCSSSTSRRPGWTPSAGASYGARSSACATPERPSS